MQFLVDYAMQYVGTPYRWGGDDPMEGFDCSGFTQELLASVGMDPPGDQTADGLYRWMLKRGIYGVKDIGALAFYGSQTRITHVAMFVDTWRVIEAAGGGSKTTSASAAADHNAFIRVRPHDHRSDLIACILPRYPELMYGRVYSDPD